jgi:hypothetical protein
VFDIPAHNSKNLISLVNEFILNGQWCIPIQLSQRFTNFSSLVQQVTIPLEHSQDILLWKHSDSGALHLAHAYNFHSPHFQDLEWSKFLWSLNFPTSKSLLAWRLMHKKIPTDENLHIRGCVLPSMCSFCCKKEESSFHIFFECEFAVLIFGPG